MEKKNEKSSSEIMAEQLKLLHEKSKEARDDDVLVNLSNAMSNIFRSIS